jgi:hypothetical protein
MANNLRFLPAVHALPRPDTARALLFSAAGSASPIETPVVAARASLARLGTGLAKEATIAAAVAARIPPLKAATAAPTLQELVERGRVLLHGAQSAARSAELDAITASAGKLATAIKAGV